MIGKEVIDEKPLTLSHVKKILADRKKEGELTYEQKISLDYVSDFGKIKPEKLDKAVEELIQFGIDPATAVRILNVMPQTKEELSLIFEKVRFDLKEAQVTQILALIEGLK